MPRHAVVALLCLAAPLAQGYTGSMRIAANGAPRITVAPGEAFSVRALITYRGRGGTSHAVQFGGVEGAIIVDEDSGSPSAFTSFYNQSGLINLGQFRGGSRYGLRFTITPAFFTGGFVPPQIPSTDGLLAAYQLSIDRPGVYVIRWAPTGNMPQIRLYPSIASPYWVDVQTTFFHATVTVTDCRPDLSLGSIPGQPGYGVPDGTLSSDDFFYFLQQYAAANTLVADMTTGAVPGQAGYAIPDGIINSDDFFFYLTLYAAGC